MDRDEGSIGGIKMPPKVPGEMRLLSLFMDIIALISTWWFFDLRAFYLILSYIIASRLYSYRGVRLKQYPVIGFLIVTIFQGPLIFTLVIWSLAKSISFPWFTSGLLLSYLIIAAGYPLSQIYQHDQDRKDGVTTISMLLGVRKTFIFSGLMFFLLFVLYVYHFEFANPHRVGWIVSVLFLLPVGVFFTKWMQASFSLPSEANYENTMKMNKMGAFAFNVGFIFILILKVFFD